MSSLKKRGRYYYIKFTNTDDGDTKEVVRSLGITRREVAEEKQKKLDRMEQNGEIHPFRPGFEIPDEKPTWYMTKDCVRDFLESRKSLSQSTIDSYTYTLKKWMRETGAGIVPIDCLDTDKHIKPFFTSDGVSNVSNKSYFRRFKTFWNWCMEEERVEDNVCKSIKLPDGNVKYVPKMIQRNEFEDLKKAFHKHQKERQNEHWYRDWMDQNWFVPAVTTIHETGIRLSEACRRKSIPGSGIKGMNLLWDNGDVHFLYIDQNKTDKEKLIPVSSHLNNALKEYFEIRGVPGPSEYLFLNGYGEPVTARNVYDQFKRYCKLAGISKKRTIHGMRHRRITTWLEKGFSLKETSMMAGNTTEMVDKVYSHLAAGRLRDKMLEMESD